MPTLYVPPSAGSLSPYAGFIPPAGTYFTLFNRIYYSLAIYNNPGNETQPPDSDPGATPILIPSLVALKYRDPLDPAANNQDRWLYFDPVDDPTQRQVHTATVYNTGDTDFGGSNANADPTQMLSVERVDVWQNFDPNAASGYQSNGSEEQNLGFYNSMMTLAGFDNVTGEGDQNNPANFKHYATHLARWFQSDGAGNVTDTNTFVDTQYIDVVQMSYAGRSYFYRFTSGWFGDYTSGQNPQPQPIIYGAAVSWGGITVQIYAVTSALNQGSVNYPTSATLSGLAGGVTITAADTQEIYFPPGAGSTTYTVLGYEDGILTGVFQPPFAALAEARSQAALWNSQGAGFTSTILTNPGVTNPSYGFAACWLLKVSSSALANLPASLATLTLGDPAALHWNVQANWFVGAKPATPLILPPVVNSYLSFYMGGPSVPAVPPYTVSYFSNGSPSGSASAGTLSDAITLVSAWEGQNTGNPPVYTATVAANSAPAATLNETTGGTPLPANLTVTALNSQRLPKPPDGNWQWS
jgi:hypothetical protein